MTVAWPIKPWVRELRAYEPGRPLDEVARELGFPDAGELIKLASNENALGPSPLAARAMRRAVRGMHRYPDGSAFLLRRALAERHGLDMAQVLIGHGSNELIAFLGHALLEAGTNIVMADRAFAVYRLVAALYQADVIDVPMRDYTHDLDAMRDAVTPRTRLVFVANPNNPTGTAVDPGALDRFIEDVSPRAPVVVDEAYVELLPAARRPDLLRHVRAGRNVLVLRTFSKAYGLAGLRVGYALGPAEVLEAFNRVRQPFNVNGMGQAAAVAALDDEAHVERTCRMTASGMRALTRAFDRLGLSHVPSEANFVLVRTGAGRAVFEAMQRRGVIVRPMDAYGLPEHVRITVGRPAENRRCVEALAAVLAERENR